MADESHRPELNFQFGIVCDSIRQEANGKFILIGVYTPDVQVEQFPANFPFSVFAKAYRTHGNEEFESAFAIRVLRDGREAFRRNGMMRHAPRPDKEQTAIYLALEGLILMSEHSCNAAVEFRVGEGPWHHIVSFDLSGPETTSTT